MAYFSNEGTPIHSGAAGVGADMGPTMAFRDGSLGQPDSGYLNAFRDGSLGTDSGLLDAFRDGSLGTDSGLLDAFRDGSLGVDAGSLSAFKDGSLGDPLFLHTSRGTQRLPSPATLYHGPQATAGCGCRPVGVGVVGQPSAGNVLDMKNPDVVREVKGLMALLAGDQLNSATPPEVFTNTFWGEESTNYAGRWIVAVGGAAGVPADTFFVAPQLYPNSTGIVAMMQMVAPTLQSEEARADFENKFPNLTSFVSATQGDPSKGSVAAPHFSEPGMKPATMALFGGLAVLVVAAAVMSKKR